MKKEGTSTNSKISNFSVRPRVTGSGTESVQLPVTLGPTEKLEKKESKK